MHSWFKPMLVLGPILSLGYDFKLSSRQINCPFDGLVEAKLQPLRQQKSWSVYQLFILCLRMQVFLSLIKQLQPGSVLSFKDHFLRWNKTWFVHGLHIQAWLALAPTMCFFCKPSGGCRVSHAIKVIYLLKKQLQF